LQQFDTLSRAHSAPYSICECKVYADSLR